jgi:putative sigma-54 modulation protein
MKIDFTARHFSLNEEVKEVAEKRIQRLDRYLEDPVSVQVVLGVEKRRYTAELIIHHRHGSLQATEEAEELRDALYAVSEKAEKQARRARKKFIDVRRRDQHRAIQWPLEVLDAESVSSGEVPQVIKVSNLQIKPMTIDEASLALGRSKNDFFVFLDANSERVSVLFRRRDNNYGLIAPEF